MHAKKLKWFLWLAAFCAVALFGLKTFVGDVYRVTSASMEPTIEEGEYVLVLFDDSPPQRFDLVVVSRPPETLVKRVYGLPDETILVNRRGGVSIKGALLAHDVPRPPPILVYDDRLHPVEDHFSMGGTQKNPWRKTGDGWELDARDVPRDSALGLMGLHHGVHDDRIARDGTILRGENHVGDLVLEFRFRALEPGGRLRAQLVEEGDTFQFSLELEEGGECQAELTRLTAGGLEVLLESRLALVIGEWTAVSFSNRDNHLVAKVGDAAPITADYAENSSHPLDRNNTGLSAGERVRLGGEGCWLVVRDLRVLRGTYVTRDGTYGVERTLRLGADEYYVLGDHSARSRDSRAWGPVARESIIGRAAAVVWPLSRMRRLRATEENTVSDTF